jgi:predicted ester cyclase
VQTERLPAFKGRCDAAHVDSELRVHIRAHTDAVADAFSYSEVVVGTDRDANTSSFPQEVIAMTTEQNKAVVRRFFEAFEADDQAALNELLAPDLVAYMHGRPDPQSREAHVQGIRMWNAAFSDTRFTIHEQIAEGAMVATRVAMRSIHTRGDFQGLPPTGKEITTGGISIERVRDGKIVGRWVIYDLFGIMQQLGLLPPSR